MYEIGVFHVYLGRGALSTCLLPNKVNVDCLLDGKYASNSSSIASIPVTGENNLSKGINNCVLLENIVTDFERGVSTSNPDHGIYLNNRYL